LPVSMVEAMAWGLPVIVTPVGGIPELVTDQKQGFLVSPGNVAEISQAIQTLVTQDQRRWAMGRASRQQVSQLDIAPYHQVLSQLYGAAMSGLGNMVESSTVPIAAQLFREKA
jgi:glycosyltransferase involved in cell wall biosynthesis